MRPRFFPILSLLTLAASGAGQTSDSDDPKVIPVKWNSVSVGFLSWTGHGSRERLRQYARPREGLSLVELKALTPMSVHHPFSVFAWRGTPGQDVLAEGELILNRGHTIIRADQQAFGHHNQDVIPALPSEDRATRLTVEHTITPNFGAFVAYRADERDQRFAGAKGYLHSTTKTIAAGIGGRALGGNASLFVTSQRHVEQSGLQPAAIQRRIEGRYGADLGPTFSLEGAMGYTRIEQDGRHDSGVRSLALAANWYLGPATMAFFNYGREDYDIKDVLSAYVQRRTNTSIRLAHRWPGWAMQVGYRRKEVERMRADHSFTDTPRWNIFDARLTGHLGATRVTLRGTKEDLTNGAVFNTDDPRSLQWSERGSGQIKFDGANDRFAAYGGYTYRWQRNQARDVTIRWHNFMVGGSYSVSDRVTAFGEFGYDVYHVNANIAGVDLGFYFPNSTTYSLGLDLALPRGQSISAAFNRYESRSYRGGQLTVQYQRPLGLDRSLELTLAPWRHQDMFADDQSYRAAFFGARLTFKY